MIDRRNDEDGFRVLDGVALVMGAAVASVHIRGIIRDDLTGFGWALVWCTFTWVSLTATGPFLVLGPPVCPPDAGISPGRRSSLGVARISLALERPAAIDDRRRDVRV